MSEWQIPPFNGLACLSASARNTPHCAHIDLPPW
jgi:hypothetical protein